MSAESSTVRLGPVVVQLRETSIESLEDVGSLSPEFELFKLQFKHRYLNDVEIETEIIGGTGYGVRLGLGYAL